MPTLWMAEKGPESSEIIVTGRDPDLQIRRAFSPASTPSGPGCFDPSYILQPGPDSSQDYKD